MSDDKPPTKGEVAGSPEESPGEALRSLREKYRQGLQGWVEKLHYETLLGEASATFNNPPERNTPEGERFEAVIQTLDEIEGLSFEEAYEILEDALRKGYYSNPNRKPGLIPKVYYPYKGPRSL